MSAAGSPTGLARHDLILVSPEAWAAAYAVWVPCRPLSREQSITIAGWAEAGRPVIARRPGPGDTAGSIAVGLPLPPGLGKLRAALSLHPDAAWCLRPAVSLVDAQADAPLHWWATMEELEALERSLGIRPSVFGALLWQHLTGLAYLHADSDLDLLWPLSDEARLPALLDGLRHIDGSSPVRLDGEVLTPAGGANWRELDAARRVGGVVLVKSLDGAALRPVADLYEIEPVRC